MHFRAAAYLHPGCHLAITGYVNKRQAIV